MAAEIYVGALVDQGWSHASMRPRRMAAEITSAPNESDST